MTSRRLLVRACCSVVGLLALATSAQATPDAPKTEGKRSSMGEPRAATDAKGSEQAKAKTDRGEDAARRQGPKAGKSPMGAPSGSGGPMASPHGSAGPERGLHHDADAGPDEQARHERRLAKLRELRGHWGEDTLKTPSAREELEHHAWRLARLNRMRELATEKKNDKLLSKLDKLDQKENERHEKAMTKLKTGAPGAKTEGSAMPKPSAVPSAAHPKEKAELKHSKEGGKP